MTFLELAEKVLEESDNPVYYKDIWEIAKNKGYDKEVNTKGKTPWDTINAYMSVSLKYKPDTTILVRTSSGYYWLKSKWDSSPENEKEKIETETETKIDKKEGIANIKEADLHEPLSQYLMKSKIYSKTIQASTNGKNGAMKWGTPDIIGVSFREELDKTLREVCTLANIPTTEFYAYELKIKLKMSNLTEYFFQAVSNSSWANEAWLVAAVIDDDIDFIEELQRLNQAFGVGILKLRKDDPINSEVIFSAKRRDVIDLNTINKLCQNAPFKEFFGTVLDILETKPENREKRIKEKIKSTKFNKVELDN